MRRGLFCRSLVVAAASACALAAAGEATSAPSAPAADPAPVLARLDAAQRGLSSLAADFVESRFAPGGGAPAVALGHVVWAKNGGKVRWEYSAPERRVHVLADGLLLGWIPAKNRFERLELGPGGARMRRLAALGQDSAALAKDFTATRGVSTADADVLDLAPKMKRARRKLAVVRLFVDKETALPSRVEYHGADGGVVVVALRGTRPNAPPAADAFALAPPAGAAVAEGTSSLGFVSGAGGADDEVRR
ncbi:MAG: outer membrane lipoprotein carrier protein LolA [Candidatus Polarisedimenticolia bacterium]|nr:outer membrane lipoprotein carrier protein LolA [bacterium]